MPSVVQGAESASYVGTPIPYKYPLGIDFVPNGEVHQKILEKVMNRAQIAWSKMKNRRESWRKIDRTLTAYIPLTDAERLVKEKDPRNPVSIVFPHSYSILETLASFLDGLFLKDPIFHYSGNSPEDTAGAILLEKVVETHCRRFKAGLALHTAFKDGIAYGLGAVFPLWKQKTGYKTRTVLTEAGQSVKQSDPAILFEGNALENVDPYQLLLDPNYGVQSIQDAEFVGFVRRTNYYSLLKDDNNGSVFNIKYLREGVCTSKYFTNPRGDKTGTEGAQTTTLRPVDIIYMYITIVPKEWGLGPVEEPEKWLFGIAGDRIVIQAQPLDLDHDMYPIAICAPTFDGYSAAPLSRLELLDGMQGLLNWLFNSHIANVRKTINDMIIYDPFALNTNDLIDPKPGKLVRARKAAWGKDVRQAITQLTVQDVTKQHMQDAQLTMSLMNQISGSDDAMMGMLRSGGPERLSAAEFQGTQGQALNRLQSIAMIVGQQLMQDVGYMFAMHTQQMMTQDVWITTVGEWQAQLLSVYGDKVQNDRMKVTPQDLNIDFDIVVNAHGADSQTEAQFWLQMFDIVARNPELYQLIDVGKVFRFVATQLGAQNVDNFLRQPMAVQPVMAPTEQVMGQAQAGNMLPIDEVANALGR